MAGQGAIASASASSRKPEMKRKTTVDMTTSAYRADFFRTRL
jgi:hypothetical protein